MKIFIVIFLMSLTAVASGQERSGARVPCYQGDIDVRNGEDMGFLRSQWCVNGSVFIRGLLMVGGEVFESLDLGRVRSISGVLVVSGNSRLKFVVSKLKSVKWIDLSANPMLAECRAELFALRAGGYDRWVGYQLPQSCGLLQWEQEELEALREYYEVD